MRTSSHDLKGTSSQNHVVDENLQRRGLEFVSALIIFPRADEAVFFKPLCGEPQAAAI